MRVSLAFVLAAAQYYAAAALTVRDIASACQLPGKPCADVANIGLCIAILNQPDKTIEDFNECIAMVGGFPTACVACILANLPV